MASKRSGSEKRILADKITVRVDPELMSRIEFAAAREGLSPASWLRLVAAAAAGDDVQAMPRKPTPKTRPRPSSASVDADGVSEFLAELGRIGNNVNQIAKALHQANLAGLANQKAVDSIIPTCKGLHAQLAAIKKRLRESAS